MLVLFNDNYIYYNARKVKSFKVISMAESLVRGTMSVIFPGKRDGRPVLGDEGVETREKDESIKNETKEVYNEV